jgi:glutamate-1-semialdehyde 2,1-aminomutase
VQGVAAHFEVVGRDCNLAYVTRDAEGRRSQPFRTLFLQELVRRGVLVPSFVVSAAHDDGAIGRTVEAVGEALRVYRQALDGGIGRFLVGRSVRPIFRRYC